MRVFVVWSPGATEWRHKREAAEQEFALQVDLYKGKEVGLYSLDMPETVMSDPDGAAVEFCEAQLSSGAAELKGEKF